MVKKPDQEVMDLIKATAAKDPRESAEALYELAQAVETPLRDAVLSGNVAGGIFETVQLEPGRVYEYPVSFLNPGEEDDYRAWTNPGEGRIPQRQIEGDYVTIPTHGIASSIDWPLRFARDGGYDVVAKALQVLRAGFEQKMSDEAWYTILAAAADRNIVVYDADAANGQFTKRLVSLAKVIMRRNGGGNTASANRSMLTDLYLSPEGIEDIRNWGVDQLDEITRREIYTSADGGISRIFNVNLTDLDEFGVGSDFQVFFEDVLGGEMAAGDLEIAVGLDRSKNDCFIMPVKEEISIFPDPALHRSQLAGYYGWGESGVGVLDNRRVLLLSY
jgi:hypothetical protein